MKLSAQLDEIEKVSLHRFYYKPCVGSQFSAIFWPSRISTLTSVTVRVIFLTWNSIKRPFAVKASHESTKTVLGYVKEQTD